MTCHSSSFVKALDYSDVLIVPQKSELESRKDVDLTTVLCGKHSKKRIKCLPIISSNIFSTGTMNMARVLSQRQMLTALHKFYDLKELNNFYQDRASIHSFITIGIKDSDIDKLKLLPPYNIVIDVANGYTLKFLSFVKQVRDMFPDRLIIAGNVCTPEGCYEILKAGADIVKCGIGSGALCTTRIMTGVGYPMFSMLQNCVKAAKEENGLIIADGGITSFGDVAKALSIGADLVMIGTLFSGHKETNILEKDKNGNSIVYGMSSHRAQKKHLDGKSSHRASEGRVVKVPDKGNIINTLYELEASLRSTCTYIGAKSIKELAEKAKFIEVNRTHNTFLANSTIE